jgi:hypothetical protein
MSTVIVDEGSIVRNSTGIERMGVMCKVDIIDHLLSGLCRGDSDNGEKGGVEGE